METKHGCEIYRSGGHLVFAIESHYARFPGWAITLGDVIGVPTEDEYHGDRGCRYILAFEPERLAREIRRAGADIPHVREHADALLDDLGRLAALDTLDEILAALREDAEQAERDYAIEAGHAR